MTTAIYSFLTVLLEQGLDEDPLIKDKIKYDEHGKFIFDSLESKALNECFELFFETNPSLQIIETLVNFQLNSVDTLTEIYGGCNYFNSLILLLSMWIQSFLPYPEEGNIFAIEELKFLSTVYQTIVPS